MVLKESLSFSQSFLTGQLKLGEDLFYLSSFLDHLLNQIICIYLLIIAL